ncbi:MAG: aldehyde dehydrogenase [Myxococcota bacterium]|jgi:aldehyde dehydrogenase
MANYTDQQIASIVDRVIGRLAKDGAVGVGPTIHNPTFGAKDGVFPDADSAVAAARIAFEQVGKTPLETRRKAIEAMRQTGRRLTNDISRMAVEETGLGRVADKINKNLLVANKTPGMELVVPTGHSGDHGLTIDERAPYGVICSITPCTNATETILNNAISMLSGGNTVVFNVHPSAKNVNNYFVRELNQAMTAVGYPANTLCSIGQPTIKSAGALMNHPGVRMVVVTGGPAVVKAAMATGKKCIAAGPGNPPALVDETADLAKAARDIGAGHSLDNNIVCIIEKVVVAVSSIADKLKEEFGRTGAYLLNDRDVAKLEKVILDDNHINRKFVGKNVSVILKEIGINVSDDVRFALCEVDEAHPFVQLEQLMPILPMFRVASAQAGIEAALRVEHGFFHTSTCHSQNINVLSDMARAVNTSIFVKNGPSYAGLGMGGEGYTSWTIAGPTGEGLTTSHTFTRKRRCTLVDAFRIC